MNPKDRDTSSQNPSSDRRDQTETDSPRQGAAGGYGNQSGTSGSSKRSGSDAADGTYSDDEDSDQGEETRQAGGTNTGQRRESPDDAMRRERSRQDPPQSGGPQKPGS